MHDLQLYGWNDELFRQKQASNYKDLLHGRVTVTHKTCYEVVAESEFYTCELVGNMLYGKESSDFAGKKMSVSGILIGDRHCIFAHKLIQKV